MQKKLKKALIVSALTKKIEINTEMPILLS